MTIGMELGFAALGFVLLEALLLAFWVPWFYRHGVGLFRTTVPIPSSTIAPEAELEERFAGGAFSPRLAFRRLSEREIAFQEAASFTLWSPYVPVMRGLIEYRPERGQLRVSGILLLYPVVAVLAAVGAVWEDGVWKVVGVAAAIIMAWLVMMALQWTRFRDVATALKEGPPNNEMQRTKPAQAMKLRR